jgi:hypothetical protein
MPVIFGEKREDGKIVVGCVQYQIDIHPNGITVDNIPDYPVPVKGKNTVQLFDPITKEFSYEQVDRQLTKDEMLEDFNANMLAKLDQIIALLKK